MNPVVQTMSSTSTGAGGGSAEAIRRCAQVRTCPVKQDGLRDPLASASQALGLKGCITTTLLFKKWQCKIQTAGETSSNSGSSSLCSHCHFQ